jgi:RNA polymerase sigma-70 factor (ECF subfamily)
MAERTSLEPAPEGQKPAAAVDMTALVVAYHAAVYRYARRLCGCPTEAEDLTQQAFLLAQRKLHQLRDPERASGWLLAIVRSCFLKSLRKLRPIPSDNMEWAACEEPDESSLLEEVDREALHAALMELPDEFRLVLLMFYFEDLSYQQIAEELEAPIGTVMSRLSRAKGHLRKRLLPSGEGPSGKSSNVVTRAKGRTLTGDNRAAANRATIKLP